MTPARRSTLSSICLLLSLFFILLGCAALCYCPGFYITAAVLTLPPLFLAPRRFFRLVALLILIISLTQAIQTARALSRQTAAITRLRALHPATLP